MEQMSPSTARMLTPWAILPHGSTLLHCWEPVETRDSAIAFRVVPTDGGERTEILNSHGDVIVMPHPDECAELPVLEIGHVG